MPIYRLGLIINSNHDDDNNNNNNDDNDNINNNNVNCKKAFLKRNILSLFLKTDTNELFLISNGRAFPSVGAATEKDLVPYVK